jgi:glycosyltransferase involved in cell wall biosynthesis
MGGRVYRIPHILKDGPFRYRHNLASFFEEHREYKIIHSHMDKMSGIVLDEAKKAGIPIRIAHSHSTDSEGGLLERGVKRHYGKYLRNVPTDRIACSADAGKWLFEDATDGVTILKNGILFDDFCFSGKVRENKRNELGLNKNDKVLLHIGRFDKAKNQSFAIDVFKEIYERDGNYRFLLAGDGELLNSVKARAKALGIHDRVEFLGLRNDVSGLMAASDALIFPSLYEGLSLVLIEAQTSGLPCVITDTLSEESVMRPELVVRLPLGNAVDWAKATVDSVGSHERAYRISKVAPEYDIRNTAVKLEHFYIQRASEELLYDGSGD